MLKITKDGVTKTHFTSVYAWVHHEAFTCAALNFSADMFAAYLRQYLSLNSIKSIMSRQSYNNVLAKHQAK